MAGVRGQDGAVPIGTVLTNQANDAVARAAQEADAAVARVLDAQAAGNTEDAPIRILVGQGTRPSGLGAGRAGDVPIPSTINMNSYATDQDILKQVYGWAGAGDGSYWSLAEQLTSIGALYDMRYARNVNSVAEATNNAILMYTQSGQTDTPFFEWLANRANSGTDPYAKTRTTGGGGSAGPQPADASSIRRAMDEVSRNLVGRTLGDDEFDKYYKSYVSAFSGNPDMDPTQDMIERVREEDDYQEFQVATKFAGALSGVLKGSI